MAVDDNVDDADLDTLHVAVLLTELDAVTELLVLCDVVADKVADEDSDVVAELGRAQCVGRQCELARCCNTLCCCRR